MIALLWELFLVMLAVTAVGYVTVRVMIGGARMALGVGADDPARKALRMADKIRGHLESSKAGEMYGAVLTQLGELASVRLPRLAETRDRLESHLREKPLAQLEQQVLAFRSELAAAKDPEIRQLAEKNLKLASERLELHQSLDLVLARTVAQIKNALITLEALEDRVVSVKLIPSEKGVAKELEVMLEDVASLETEYKRLQLL